MSAVVLVLLSCTLIMAANAVNTPPAEETDAAIDIAILKEYFQDQARQGTALLALQIMDLVREVKDIADSVKKLEEKIEAVSVEQKSIVSSMAAVSTGVTSVEEKIDVIRSEVRLISQHKLTWQNSTWRDVYHPDFAVDGVYTLVEGHSGSSSNPMQKSGQDMNKKGNMLIIDLGGFFKIHSIKLWNRIDGSYSSYAMGVLIYADDQLIGSIHDDQRLYTFRANEGVYGSKVYLKQSLDQYMNFIEVQVFGCGPYSEDEL